MHKKEYIKIDLNMVYYKEKQMTIFWKKKTIREKERIQEKKLMILSSHLTEKKQTKGIMVKYEKESENRKMRAKF